LALAEQHPRYGFRKLLRLLKRQGHTWNHKRVYRVYCSLSLNLRKKPKKRLPCREAKPLQRTRLLGSCWSLDYMSDALQNGKRFRTANVIDDCNRGCLGIDVAHSLPANRITRWLDTVATVHGYPARLRVDNAPENIAKHMQAWAKQHHIELLYIQPGKPAQNAYIERFNRSYREEILDMYLFDTIEQVQQLTDKWLVHYNNHRPHEALSHMTPKEFSQQLSLAC
jgi:putative transposase